MSKLSFSLFIHKVLVLLFISTISIYSQFNNPNKFVDQKIKLISHQPKESIVSLHPSFYDRKTEWDSIVRYYWGYGEALANKLLTFDTYKLYATKHFATFRYNPINWDSLTTTLKSRINDSTRIGTFARILNDLTFPLRDGHAMAYNNIVLNTALNPGTPILCDGGGFISHFGAGLTPLADSTLLVYKVVVPNHPLGIQPGDIILGYQGVPWMQIVREMLASGIVPHTFWNAAAPSAHNRVLMWAAGESWHLFDTIDVKKFNTGEILHLPLDSMVTLNVSGTHINNEQIPITGITMPIYFPDHGAIQYGKVSGTNIGYIYVYHHAYENVSQEFSNAVENLIDTDGLVIDLRIDWGGSYGLNAGISKLLNHYANTLTLLERCSQNDLYSLCQADQNWWDTSLDNDISISFDRPIAILLGPNCLSYGDITSWQLMYLPTARTFGRSPSAIYSGAGDSIQPYRAGYTFNCPNITFEDYHFENSQRWGTEFPIYKEVWLTPEGVANGVDDVVQSALDWIKNLAYPYNTYCAKNYYSPQGDSLFIFTEIKNPNAHQVSSKAYLINSLDEINDSTDLITTKNYKLKGLWSGKLIIPANEDFYSVKIIVFDNTIIDNFEVKNSAFVTTAGPLKVDSLLWAHNAISNFVTLKPYLTNLGQNMSIAAPICRIICNDPWLINSEYFDYQFPDINPDTTILGNHGTIRFNYDSTFPGYFNLKFEIFSGGVIYWQDSLKLFIQPTNAELQPDFPYEYSLSYNYPNPFNPSTTIKYQIPEKGLVSIFIYDVLGRKVATLVNEEKPAGNYEVEFSTSSIKHQPASGVYFYQLKAGEFIQTRKMILLK